MVIRGLELVTNCTVLSKTKQKNENVGVESKDGYGVSKWKSRIYLQFLYHSYSLTGFFLIREFLFLSNESVLRLFYFDDTLNITKYCFVYLLN